MQMNYYVLETMNRAAELALIAARRGRKTNSNWLVLRRRRASQENGTLAGLVREAQRAQRWENRIWLGLAISALGGLVVCLVG